MKALVLVLVLLTGCAGSRNLPKKSAQISPTLNDQFYTYKYRAWQDSTEIARLNQEIRAFKRDSVTLYVTVIQNSEEKTREENKKLSKRVIVWKVLACVFFFVATGQILGL